MTVLDFEDEDCLKTLLIDAIIGVGFTNNSFAVQMEKYGLAKVIGNQYNPDWQWQRTVLQAHDLDFMQNLYGICKNQDEACKLIQAWGQV